MNVTDDLSLYVRNNKGEPENHQRAQYVSWDGKIEEVGTPKTSTNSLKSSPSVTITKEKTTSSPAITTTTTTTTTTTSTTTTSTPTRANNNTTQTTNTNTTSAPAGTTTSFNSSSPSGTARENFLGARGAKKNEDVYLF